jgi:copper chaperone CopZ
LDEITYSVPGMSCAHCEQAVKAGVSSVSGVADVRVDLEAKQVTVRGPQLDDGALRAAIDEAGYDVAEVSAIQ